MNPDKYKISLDLCEAHLNLIEANIEAHKAEKAMWMLYKAFLERGKEVYVKGNKFAFLDKGDAIPSSLFENEKFISKEKLIELKEQDEIGVLFYETLISLYEGGDAIMHDHTTNEFRVISNSAPAFMM